MRLIYYFKSIGIFSNLVIIFRR